ncbi:Hypothetical predicted protein, partial [Pelobates cultripes]
VTNEIKKEMAEMGERTNSLEARSDKICHAQNKLAESIASHTDECKLLKRKLADLEDRSRWSN